LGKALASQSQRFTKKNGFVKAKFYFKKALILQTQRFTSEKVWIYAG
jgi:hypothetical protein